MTLLLTVLLSFPIVLLAVAAMSIGVTRGRQPIKGSCGGLGGGGLRALQHAMRGTRRSGQNGRVAMTSLKSARVRDYMSRRLITFSPNDDVLDAIQELVRQRIAGAPVVDEQGNLIGMLSELDCLAVALTAGYHGELGGPVADFMTPEATTIDAEMSIVDLAQRFIESGFRRYPVVTDGRLVGVVSRRDVLRALGELAVG